MGAWVGWGKREREGGGLKVSLISPLAVKARVFFWLKLCTEIGGRQNKNHTNTVWELFEKTQHKNRLIKRKENAASSSTSSFLPPPGVGVPSFARGLLPTQGALREEDEAFEGLSVPRTHRGALCSPRADCIIFFSARA